MPIALFKPAFYAKYPDMRSDTLLPFLLNGGLLFSVKFDIMTKYQSKPEWRNGRRSGFKIRRLRAWGFKSLLGHVGISL